MLRRLNTGVVVQRSGGVRQKNCSSPVGNKTRSAQLQPCSYNSNPLLLQAQFQITHFKQKKTITTSTVRVSLTSLPKLTLPPPKKIVLWTTNIYHWQNKCDFGSYSNESRSTKRSPSMTFPAKNTDSLLVHHTHVSCPTVLRSPIHSPYSYKTYSVMTSQPDTVSFAGCQQECLVFSHNHSTRTLSHVQFLHQQAAMWTDPDDRPSPPYTRVETLIKATIYLQLIQNRYIFRSFTVLQCSHQHCVQPVASDVEVVGYL